MTHFICRLIRKIVPLAAVFAMISVSTAWGQATAGQSLFEKRCYSCHNIGNGVKKGPDLKGVTTRRTPGWIAKFVSSPSSMNRSGDPTATELFAKFSPEVMPDQTLSADELNAILSMIGDLTKANGQFIPAGARLARAITAADAPAGLNLFTGAARLKAGGPPCISCHNLSGAGILGGGTLGPDLTAVNVKYRDPELISILQNPNFPTMTTVFASHPIQDDEIVRLFALFQKAKQTAPVAIAANPPGDVRFPLLGFGAMVPALVVLNLVWRKRNRGVREEMLRRKK